MKNVFLGATIILAMLAGVIPAVIADLERAAQASSSSSTSRARGVAAVAAEFGRRQLWRKSDAWGAVLRGTPPPGFDLDAAFSEEPGTRYAVRLASGPGDGQVTITGVGQDLRDGEVSALSVVYELAPGASQPAVRCRWGARLTCD